MSMARYSTAAAPGGHHAVVEVDGVGELLLVGVGVALVVQRVRDPPVVPAGREQVGAVHDLKPQIGRNIGFQTPIRTRSV